jgi:hypothetical protein
VRWLLFALAGCGFRGREIADARPLDASIDAAPDASTLGDGLIAWYTLDTAPPAVDSISGLANGTCTESHQTCPTLGPGKHGMAYEFDGVKSSIEIAPGTTIRPAQLTVAFWANWAVLPAPDSYQCPVGKIFNASTNDNSWQLCIEGLAGGANQWLDISEQGPPADALYTPATIALGVWYHLAITYDGTTKTIYVDGAPLPTTTHPTTPIEYDDGDVTLGCDLLTNGTIDVPFHGALDDVRIYDRALSPAEILALSD